MRKIIHIDMDAFFASVEQRDHPEWQGKPLVVGSSTGRGVVAAASYEARKFGVRSAMPSSRARLLCPDLIFAPHRFDVYKEVSGQIRAIFLSYTDLVEPLSLDEAYLDVTDVLSPTLFASQVAHEIRTKIQETTGLTASAGVSYNKFLAKLASDMQKPNGMTIIRPQQALTILDRTPIERFYGIGPSTAKKMHALNVTVGKDLRNITLEVLVKKFGKQGHFFHQIANGQDDREVQPFRERKSIAVERTFENDLKSQFQYIVELYNIEKELMERADKAQFLGKTLTLKVRFHDFEMLTKSKTYPTPINNFNLLHLYAKALFHECKLADRPIRLLGLSISNSPKEKNDQQLSFVF